MKHFHTSHTDVMSKVVSVCRRVLWVMVVYGCVIEVQVVSAWQKEIAQQL